MIFIGYLTLYCGCHLSEFPPGIKLNASPECHITMTRWTSNFPILCCRRGTNKCNSYGQAGYCLKLKQKVMPVFLAPCTEIRK